MTRRRGAAAVRRCVFDPDPAEGRWATVVLLDGNVGIGGDPPALAAGAGLTVADVWKGADRWFAQLDA